MSIHYKSLSQDGSYFTLPQTSPISSVHRKYSAKLGKMPRQKSTFNWTEVVKTAIESGDSDMLGEVLQQTPDLDWTEVAKTAIESGDSDMLGEVLRQKPGIDCADMAEAAIDSSHSDMLGAVLQQKLGFDRIEAVEMQMDLGASIRNTTIIEKERWTLLLFAGFMMWLIAGGI